MPYDLAKVWFNRVGNWFAFAFSFKRGTSYGFYLCQIPKSSQSNTEKVEINLLCILCELSGSLILKNGIA